MSQKNASHHILALVGYSLLTLLYTFPTAWRLTSHIPGSGDAPWFLWQLWWFKYAIVHLRQSPLVTDMIYHPLQDVPIAWQSPFNELAAIPLQAAFGPVVAYNLLLLSSFILSGYCMYLLILQVIPRILPAGDRSQPLCYPGANVPLRKSLAFAGGLIFAFCAYRGMRGLHHLSLATTQWMPLSLALAIGLWRKPTLGRAVAAGVATGLVTLSSPYYVAYFLAPVAAVGGIYLVVALRPTITRRHLSLAVATAAVTAVMALPFYLGYVQAPADIKAAAQEASAATSVYTADILSWLLPPRDNPIWGPVTAGIYERFTTGYLTESTLFFGLAPLVFGLSMPLLHKHKPRQGAFWWTLAFITFILSFGPILRFWLIDLLEWMPYRLVMLIPGSYAFRAPARIGITTVIAGTVATMLWLSYHLARPGSQRQRHFRLVLWSGLLLASMAVAFPYPLSSTAIPEVYQGIAAAPSRTAVLDLPAGELFQERTSWAMYYQTFHQKPLVSGYLGRRPDRLHEPEQILPFVRRFFAYDWTSYFAGEWQNLVEWPPEHEVLAGDWPEDILHAGELLATQGIEHAVVHRDADQPSYFESASLLLTQGLGLPVYADSDTLRFHATLPSIVRSGASAHLDQATLVFSTSFSQPAIHRQSQARSLHSTGRIVVDTILPGRWLLRGQLDGREAPNVTFSLDGTRVTPDVVHLFGNVYAFSLAMDVQQPGSHVLTLHGAPGEARAAMAGSEDTCNWLCLLNFTATLDQLALPATDAYLASFGGDQDKAIYLTDVVVLPPSSTNPDYQLLTTWYLRVDDLNDGPKDAPPTLYVHLIDPSGDIVLQADHTLGDKSLRSHQGTAMMILLDQVSLPLDETSAANLEIRAGLWYPENQTSLAVRTGAQDTIGQDSVGRIRLGTIKEMIHATSN